MRKLKAGTILLFLFVIVLAVSFLTGCSSLSAIVKSNLSGLPFWYYSPQSGIRKGMTAIVGTGQALTSRQAELLAYSDVISQLSATVGYDLGQEAYRELSVLGTVSELGLYINDAYSVFQDGMNYVYLHVVMDEELLKTATSEEMAMRNKLGSTIKALVLEGDEFVKSGREIKAVDNYLQAMALGYDLDYIDSEYSFDALYEVVMDLLKNVSMTILSQRPASASCTVSMTRKGTFVSSAVTSAEVLSSYKASDVRGNIYEDSFVYVTDDDGQFVFNPINYSIVRKGTVVFSLNLASVLSDLEKKAGTEKVAELRAAIESKTISFSYNMTYALGDIAVVVVEHDRLGNVTGVKDITDYLTGKFTADDAKAAAFYSELDDEEDILYEFQHSGRTENCLLVVRVGQLDGTDSATGLFAHSSEGIVTLFSCRDSKVLYRSDVVYASAISETPEAAVTDSFKTFADLIYSLVKAVYV